MKEYCAGFIKGFFMIILFFLIWSAGFIIGFSHGRQSFQRDAIKVNVAEYKINPKTGKPEFVFLSPQSQ